MTDEMWLVGHSRSNEIVHLQACQWIYVPEVESVPAPNVNIIPIGESTAN